jgi:hypothetical protein
MNLVIVGSSDNKEKELCQEVCEASHRFHIEGIDRVVHVTLPFCNTLGIAVRNAIDHGVSDDFILTTETTFVTSEYDITKAYRRSRFIQRKGESIDRMVNSIGYLLQNGQTSFDYEIDIPILVSREKALEVLDIKGQYHFRTMYGNMVHRGDSERIEDVLIDPWIHSIDPEGPIVSVGPTALKHSQCTKWIRKLHSQCQSTHQTLPAQP